MGRFDSLEDSNSIQQYLCSDEFDTLLSDKKVADKIYNLLWQENRGQKSAFTRFINKISHRY